MTDGRIGSSMKKTPEQIAREMNAEDDSELFIVIFTQYIHLKNFWSCLVNFF